MRVFYGWISSLIMDVLSLEEDDEGMFLTQTPSREVGDSSQAGYLDNFVEFEDTVNGFVNEPSVGNMNYSDISDDEFSRLEGGEEKKDVSFE